MRDGVGVILISQIPLDLSLIVSDALIESEGDGVGVIWISQIPLDLSLIFVPELQNQ